MGINFFLLADREFVNQSLKDSFSWIFQQVFFSVLIAKFKYYFLSKIYILFPADVLNTLLEHETGYLSTNEQEEEGDIDDERYVTEIDVEEDKDEEEHGVEPSAISIIPSDYRNSHRASTFSTISSTSKDSMFSTLSVASESYAPSLLSITSGADSDYFEDPDDYICSSPVAEKCSPRSTKSSARLSQHFYRLFIKPKSPLSRAKSLGNTESKDLFVVREKRSNSLPQQVRLHIPEPSLQPQSQTLKHVCFRRRPILSSDEDIKNITLRVVVFGADHVAGKVARAYNDLRRKETACPRLSRAFNLQFYFVPVKKDSAVIAARRGSSPLIQPGASKGTTLCNVSARTPPPISNTRHKVCFRLSYLRRRAKKT